jgi:predicted 3-demethylubiquinone-9 3-methyltransferase (glyoxalase superfamily)
MPTITPFLWFNDNAEAAMNFYASVFPNTKVLSTHRAQGKVMSVEFEVEGQRFIGLNGGPLYTFTEAVSFFVSCETQAEIDRLWAALTADGGAPGQCGWLKDKFGVSWQIVPKTLGALLGGGGDSVRAGRVMQAMLQMKKLDLHQLQRAYDGV